MLLLKTDMDIRFSLPLADGRNFPAVSIKSQPEPQWLSRDRHWQATNKGNWITSSKARYALALAAQALKLPAGNNIILLPAYHCPALVEPFMFAGYQIVFYPLLPSLDVDMPAFSRLMQADISHVLVVNYFGFKQNANDIIKLAHSAGKIVIEDCAHSLHQFFATCQQRPAAIAASVSSVVKTIAAVDGGVLYLRDNVVIPQQSASLVTELKSMLSQLKTWLQQPTPAVNHSVVGKAKTTAVDAQPPAKFRYFKPGLLRLNALRKSQWDLRHTDYDKVKQQRRHNYAYLAEKLANSASGTVLYPQLAADDVPYVLPFILHEASTFDRLRQQGVQALRWEELAATDCGVSAKYKSLLVQLPCHHQLSTAQLAVIASILDI